METILIKAAQLILAFAILVIIHEFGHFFFARLFGIRVEKFYIFFDPWFEIFKWKPKKYMASSASQSAVRVLKTTRKMRLRNHRSGVTQSMASVGFLSVATARYRA